MIQAPTLHPRIGSAITDAVKAAAPDPVMGAVKDVALKVSTKAVEFLAIKVAEETGCQSSENENREIFTQTFCLIVRGVAGIDDKEWAANITNKLEQITSQLTVIDQKIDQINTNLNEVLKNLSIVQLGIEEIIRGMSAYQALTDIQTYYQRLNNLIGVLVDDIKKFNPASSPKNFAERNKQQLESFYKELFSVNIHQKIDLVITSLTENLADKPSLLRNIITQIQQKLKGTKLEGDSLQITTLFEAYVSSIIIDLGKGYSLYSQLAQFVHMKITDKITVLPYTVEEWDGYYKARCKFLLNAFNKEVERMVLLLRLENMDELSPYFLNEKDEFAFASADRFTSIMLNEPFGIRGRIFSMGDLFDGKITISLANNKTLDVKGEKHTVSLGKRVDWWVATSTDKKVYDEVHFSDSWTVYRYHIKDTAKGYYPLTCEALPYKPGAVLVESFNASTYERLPTDSPDSNTNVFHFGSFTEIERAGGAFAFVSGSWNKTKPEDKHKGGGAKDIKSNFAKAELVTKSFKNDRWKMAYDKSQHTGGNYPRYNDETATLRQYDLYFLETTAAVWGRVEWNVASSSPSFIDRIYSVEAISTKQISCPDAKKVDVIFKFKQVGYAPEIPHFPESISNATACGAKFNFTTTWITTHGCKIISGFDVKFSDNSGSLSKGIEKSTDKNHSSSDSKILLDNGLGGTAYKVNFNGKKLSLSVKAYVDYKVESSGWDKTEYYGIARVVLTGVSFEPFN